jgi:predicted metalloprotease with PDZ domain
MKRLAILLAFALHLSAATVFVDATDARRGLFHTHVTLPATAGPMTFVYPKWIPGEHTPTGPLMQMAGLHVRACSAGNSACPELAWSRDRIDMFAFHVDVPRGASAIDVDFDYLSPWSIFGGGYGETPNATQHLLELPWNQVVVYPDNTPSDKITFTASLRLPAGWKLDTALPIASQSGERIDFQPVSLTTLVDSPVLAGEFTRSIPAGDVQHIFLAGDSASSVAMSDADIAHVQALVRETDALFGARHYRHYTWLLGLSDLLDVQGLEHHESTDIRAPERAYADAAQVPRYITVMSHEFVHSWNGKYRRPASLATPDYQQPMVGELLWVYEGMTRYLGDLVLTARSGMRTPEEDREFAAYVAGGQEHNRPGRNWRPLVDTAVAVQSIATAPSEEVPYRRGLDYYDESMLIWLDADTTIRAKTNGAKSFDDFCKIFFGPTTAPMVKTYTLDDVAAALNQVVPNDWRAFLEQRVWRVNPKPNVNALEQAGWRLIYNATPNGYGALRERTGHTIDASFSLGFWAKGDGTVTDVVYGTPADLAGLTPQMKITSVNGHTFSDDALHDAIRAKTPITLAAEQGTSSVTLRIDYTGGERYPHLERIAGTPDLLTDILRPRAK